jgi:hypothetical protein
MRHARFSGLGKCLDSHSGSPSQSDSYQAHNQAFRLFLKQEIKMWELLE